MEKKDHSSKENRHEALEKMVDESAELNADLSVEADTKAQGAVTLVLAGASYHEVAKIQGYSTARQAKRAVEIALASASNSEEAIDEARTLMRMRYKRILAAHMPRALDPKDSQQLAYSARVLAILDRMSKLDGLDAPAQINITQTDERIQEFVEMLTPVANAQNKALEADIFDGEIVEDGDDGQS